eukprot:scpid48151/ scgid12226/ D-2-hydroxyglutarate dehydrogenase, mitochondrial
MNLARILKTPLPIVSTKLLFCRALHVPLTASRLPHLHRKSFAKVTNDDIKQFEGILSSSRVLCAEEDIAGHCTDWTRVFRGTGSIVLKPKTTAEVSEILKYCNNRNLAVVPQGGLTGLVGGSVPVFDEVIISLSLMNKIITIEPLAGVLVCQAGCVLQRLNDAVAEHGMTMPLDLGAKGACQIGGNVSTNAGGIRFLRYGSLHASVLGLEAVMADGSVVDNLSTLRKDNTGYDVKQLFIGSEGTLGIVTSVTIATPPKPKAITVCFVGCRSFADALKTYASAKASLGEILSACEFMDNDSMSLVKKNLGLVNPLGESYPFYVLLETSGSDGSHDEDKVTKFVEAGSSFENGTLTSEPSKIKNIWSLRENIAVALLRDGVQHKFDISVPVECMYDLVEIMRKRVHGLGAVSCVGYGHLGDGNLHLNITSRERIEELDNAIVPFVYEWTAQRKGSISAEHGLGVQKSQYIHFSKTPPAIALMRSIKSTLDPKGILNPYKVLPIE